MRLEKTNGVYMRTGKLHQQDMDVYAEVYQHDCYRVKPHYFTDGVVIDIGAHIGFFSLLVRDRFKVRNIVCVEACPDNWATLLLNVGGFAKVHRAACSYQDAKDLVLANSICDKGVATGGSMLVKRSDALNVKDPYRVDDCIRETVTLDKLVAPHQMVDVLKLDCEGSEFDILQAGNLFVEQRVRRIVAEFHDRKRWETMVARLYPTWRHQIIHASPEGLGIAKMENPACLPVG